MVSYSFRRGWEDDGEPFLMWEPTPISITRYVYDPNYRLGMTIVGGMVGKQAFLNGFVRWLTFGQQGYRSMGGIVFEAFTNRTPSQALRGMSTATRGFLIRAAPWAAAGILTLAVGQAAGQAIYHSTTLDTGGGYMQTHPGGGMSFRNPITGM